MVRVLELLSLVEVSEVRTECLGLVVRSRLPGVCGIDCVPDTVEDPG